MSPHPSFETPTTKKKAGVQKKFYQLNATFALLPEISALFLKAQVLLERRIDKDILALGDIRYLAFLGIFAGKTKSPVDVFIVGTVDLKGLQKLFKSMEDDLGTEINFSVMSPDEFRYRKDITDRFLYAILEAPKNVLIDRLNETTS
jgi:hypothetical protein